MSATARSFEVEHAGCPACADRVRSALSELGRVEQITIDEEADSAFVLLQADGELEQVEVSELLARVSVGSGHAYRVRAGSWEEA